MLSPAVWSAIIALAIGIACLVVAYQVPRVVPPISTILLALGWALVIIGGVLLILALLGIPLSPPLTAFLLGVAMLVVAYQVAGIVRPIRVLLLVFGWILAIIGGILVVLELLGVPVPIRTG
jgi:hypothetical protein